MHRRIKTARLERSVSQSQLAKLLQVSRSAISQWESVTGSLPNLAHLLQIARVLEVNFIWLATGNHDNIKGDIYVMKEVKMGAKLNAEEDEILKLIQKMPAGKKRTLLTFLRYD